MNIINADDNEYYKVEDINEVLFSKEAINQILLYEKTVELVGIVGQGEIRSNLLKFTLENRKKDVIQILVWDADIIEKIKSKIMPGNVLHIDGGFAKHRNTSLSGGNVEFDLTVMSNTEVRLLQAMPNFISKSGPDTFIPIVSIEDSVKYSGPIQVTGYIKNAITETGIPNAKINQGCLSDCVKYKLEVRMSSVCDMSDFKMGTHVKVGGTIKYSTYPYLQVFQQSDIEIQSAEIKKLNELLKGTKIPKKPSVESAASNKKMKLEK